MDNVNGKQGPFHDYIPKFVALYTKFRQEIVIKACKQTRLICKLTFKSWETFAEVTGGVFVSEARRKQNPDALGQLGQQGLVVQPQVRPLVAGPVVLAGHGLALLDVGLAVPAREPVPARAVVVVDFVGAGGVVATRRLSTLVDVHLAVVPHEAGVGAVAGVHVDAVVANALVQAGVRVAVVNVHLRKGYSLICNGTTFL